MSDLFEAFLPALLAREGGQTFSDRPADRGGPTRWGITAATLGGWRRLGRPATALEVSLLGHDEAAAIYRGLYWHTPGFDQVAVISPRIAEELVDSGVNLGPAWPARWLQRGLNLLNMRGAWFADLVIDDDAGPKTRAALQGLIQRRGQRQVEDLVLKLLNGFQLARYVEICEAGGPNGDQEANIAGWLAQRIGL